MFPADILLKDCWRVTADDLMLAREGRGQQCACRHDCIVGYFGTFQQHTFATNPHMVAHQDGLVGIDTFVFFII